ncbi:aminotransferase class I/II-fold pyridoxal phosphate-dependent enzyme [Zunongwangia sp. F260]|uniref:Aminotransferase class I/II-fold pyridoxal phosphate-dependent enzyme n=1 Tax=Autumnicola lenta TaxID=3075593 RepID=A0ABU3CMS3_9FLAO|nr:aminotransferase class I/II-fold pyridoxal phosphate-dependent enzyme [Zunongwangia sp. F260]MDT0647621.1 aminotransferase class I/II-fold pyridoxal phosphate-dependent enzyme [Zunongwangia sp. F260]
MDDLKKQILALSKISSTLEPSEAQRDGIFKEVQQYANTFLNNLLSTKAYSSEKAKKEAFSITAEVKPLKKILEIYDSEVADKGIHPASGGHLGYIPGGGIYTSALADYLVDITNEYAGLSFASPGAVAMEHELLDWMKSLFGFPESAVGNLTSGGSIANMIGLTAARDKHKIKGAKIEKSVVYLSPQLHHSCLKALRIIGLEDIIIRHLQLDSNSKIIPEDFSEKLQKDKENGLEPFLLIASGGTTDTGAVDPLKELGEIANQNKLWYHIDAAYGGFFILTEQRKKLFEGIEMADSLAVDPHKGLFLPFGLGAVLVKDKEAVFHSHHHSANYMQDAHAEVSRVDPADVSPELTKHFRALRLWLPLQLHGIAPFTACLEEKLLLTRYFRGKMLDSGFRVGPEPDLSVTYFWWPRDENEDEFNKKVLKEIHEDGTVFLSSTLIDGKFVIRLAVLSFRTKIETIDRAVEVLISIVRKLEIKFKV